MTKHETNEYGLTFREWYLAAGFTKRPGRLAARMAWLDGEDPTEWSAARSNLTQVAWALYQSKPSELSEGQIAECLIWNEDRA